ncbi:MAG: sigma 54-dependent Fis family transcriptional regulator, partial [Polyangiaceae bacterium]|nr:sigma 54-dependent Fis family transcriptional regulator [Polyangiaceae bacterium]
MSAPADATRARPLHWFVRGGTLTVAGGAAVAVGVEPITVGRDASASVTVDDPEVSALHCELRAGSYGVSLRDLGSKNGTFIGPVRVDEVSLTGPCTLRVGQTDLVFTPAQSKSRVELGFDESFGPIVGSSPPMRRLYQALSAVAPTELSVLVLGETGTGKELVAQALHEHSRRKNGPFVVVDCGAVPAGLAESLLFGHEKGSFTGAIGRKAGAFLEANGGTLFLDELGELPEEVQPKLLRAVAERSVKRVGASAYEPVDVRVVAATRRDLRREMNAGRFRSDLFFRLAQVRVELPPLRERREDVRALASRTCERVGRPERAAEVAEELARRFAHYDWPGNVRELVNVASVLATLAGSTDVDSLELLLPLEGRGALEQGGAPPATAFAEAKRAAVLHFERQYFADLFKATGGNISEMARRCGMERHHVRAFLRKLGLLPADRLAARRPGPAAGL